MTRTGADAAPAILIDGLTVRFGPVTAVEELSLAVEDGQVYALLGRNGSGKSTTVRCVLGQLAPTAGRASVLGLDAWRQRRRIMARVGVVPETPDMPLEMTASQLGSFVGAVTPRWDGAGFEARLRRHGVPLGERCRRLSKGQRKQLSLALALAPSPELLILDDPTLGLDPVARAELFDELIGELADRGTTVLVTTHDLASIEGVADRVGILHHGRLLADEALETLHGRYRRLSWRAGDGSAAAALLGSLELVVTGRPGDRVEAVVDVANGAALAVVEAAAEDAGVVAEAMSLEEIFITLCGDSSGGVA